MIFLLQMRILRAEKVKLAQDHIAREWRLRVCVRARARARESESESGCESERARAGAH